MDVSELNQEQLEELRESYFQQLLDTDEEVLGNITCSEQLPMDNVIAHYEGIYFVEDDFFCTMSKNSYENI